MSLQRCATAVVVSLVFIFAVSARAAAAPSVVVAVDTSRSLDGATLASIGETASAALGQLPAQTVVGVLAFDDAPRWVLRAGSPAEATAALGSLRPAGNFTLLDDALFTAARELGRGGVVLLLTDGRDENSATTIEDVARACEARGIRVVGVGAGKRLDERRMRRLALLTGGSYVGPLAAVKSGAVGAALVEALSAPVERAAERPVETAPAGGASASGAKAPDAATVDADDAASANVPADNRGARNGNVPAALRTDSGAPGEAAGTTAAAAALPAATVSSAARWWWLALPLAVVAIAVPVAVARSRARHRTTVCKRCGHESPAGEDCPRCAAADAELALQERLRNREMTRLEDTSELRLDADAVDQLTTGSIDLDAIEKTRVIADQSMLLVREPGVSQRSFLLRSDGAFAVGRDPRTNTLAMRDPALSAHHFKVVPDNGYYYLVDLDSTNGTYVNRRRVRAAKLASGDLIQAGQVELEFRSFLGQVA